ncbi:hypothetical protein E2C01_024903 [Portunus trituberculatus]|uniref:Uncharacterized protein n=1 Tax=Portunus trituberculatus TaxID=210409 RepID=A0A5B7EDP3_PORTR|nr:hypothetical protein [Portunus trituberculatus]
MHKKELTWGLGLVGHNATDEVRVSGVQGPHQVVELLLWVKVNDSYHNIEYRYQIILCSLDFTLNVTLLRIRNPAGLLGIVRFGGILHFHFHGDEKVFGGVRVGTRALLDVARHCFESLEDLRHASLHGHGHTSVTSTLRRASGKPALYDSPGQFSRGRSAECQEGMGEGKEGRNTRGNRSSGAIWHSVSFPLVPTPRKTLGKFANSEVLEGSPFRTPLDEFMPLDEISSSVTRCTQVLGSYTKDVLGW